MAQIIVGDYFFTRNSKLGNGAFGTVYYGYHHIITNEKVAIKELVPRGDVKCITKEVAILKELSRDLNHGNILKMYTHEEIEVPNETRIYIVTELCDLSLRDFLKDQCKLSEESIKKFFIQIGNALVALHSKGIIHRDIKPDNILLVNKSNKKLGCAGVDDFIIKVADFGLADFVDDKSFLCVSTYCGTLDYMAPEVKRIDGYVKYTKKGDIWSMGLIMLECFLSRSEFNEVINLVEKSKQLVEPYEKNDNLIDYWFQSRTNRSESITIDAQHERVIEGEFRSLLEVSLKFELSSRLSAEQFILHSFFETGNNQNVIIDKRLDNNALISNPNLLSAARENNIGLVRTLLEQRADPNIKDDYGNTALHLAVLNKDDNKGLVELLLEYGANIDSQNKYGFTCLMKAAEYNKIEIVRCLLQHGADINRKDHHGSNVLHHAAENQRDNKFIIELLLKNGADIDSQNENGETCLMTAAKNYKIEIVRCLLQHGADKDIQDKNGGTCLMKAAISNNIKIVRCLLQNGADINKQNSSGYTALQMARSNGRDNKEIVELLLK